MIVRLHRATEALKRFGEGTKMAKRIRKTLVKLMQISMTLVQSSAEHGPAILTALTVPQQGEVSQAELDVHTQAQPVMEGSATGSGMLPSLVMDDPFAVFDLGMGMQPYWTDSNLDLFTDLVGVEPGLTAMMAG
jgi:hypothetical protein